MSGWRPSAKRKCNQPVGTSPTAKNRPHRNATGTKPNPSSTPKTRTRHDYTRIGIGCSVELEEIETNLIDTIYLVETGEEASSDPSFASASSPVGREILGMRAGHEFAVVVSGRTVRYKIRWWAFRPYPQFPRGNAIAGNGKLSACGPRERDNAEYKSGENLDGAKYLGFMAREGGQFGSNCLFDNFGDESGPDSDRTGFGDF